MPVEEFSEPPAIDGSVWKIVIGLVALGFFGAVSMGRIAVPLRGQDGAFAFGVFGLGGGVIAGVIGLARTRRAPLKMRVLIALAMFVGATMLGGSSAFALNRFADRSEAVSRACTVIKTTHTRDGVLALVSGVVEPEQPVEVPVSTRDRWNAMHAGDVIQVKTHTGALGWPWAETIQ